MISYRISRFVQALLARFSAEGIASRAANCGNTRATARVPGARGGHPRNTPPILRDVAGLATHESGILRNNVTRHRCSCTKGGGGRREEDVAIARVRRGYSMGGGGLHDCEGKDGASH